MRRPPRQRSHKSVWKYFREPSVHGKRGGVNERKRIPKVQFQEMYHEKAVDCRCCLPPTSENSSCLDVIKHLYLQWSGTRKWVKMKSGHWILLSGAVTTEYRTCWVSITNQGTSIFKKAQHYQPEFSELVFFSLHDDLHVSKKFQEGV